MARTQPLVINMQAPFRPATGRKTASTETGFVRAVGYEAAAVIGATASLAAVRLLRLSEPPPTLTLRLGRAIYLA